MATHLHNWHKSRRRADDFPRPVTLRSARLDRKQGARRGMLEVVVRRQDGLELVIEFSRADAATLREVLRDQLAPNEAHVYFYALPKGEPFVHQGQPYTKTGDESVRDGKGKTWTMDGHYGCLIPKDRAKALKLPRSAHRPLD